MTTQDETKLYGYLDVTDIKPTTTNLLRLVEAEYLTHQEHIAAYKEFVALLEYIDILESKIK